MRVFLAIDLPVNIKKDLENQLLTIRQEYQRFNWIPKENFHLTLHFFGEVNQPEKLINRLKEKLFDKQHFYLYSNDVNMFINKKIIIYLNFRKEKKMIEIEKEVGGKKEFIPHLTLARCRIPSKQQYFVLKKRLERLKINISFLVKEVVLFQSLPNGKYPIYQKIASFRLV